MKKKAPHRQTIKTRKASASPPIAPPPAPAPEIAAHQTTTFLSLITGSPDPFEDSPAAGDTSAVLDYLTREPYWPSRTGLAPHELVFSDSATTFTKLDFAWHGFLRGPLEPLLAAAGLVHDHNLPPWSICAAFHCLDTVKGKEGWHRLYLLGWCIGFGCEGIGLLAKWDVSLRDYAKPSDELRHHLFHRAADEAMQHPAKAIDLLTGCHDGQKEGQRRNNYRDSDFDSNLYLALNWQKLVGLSRMKICEKLASLRIWDNDTKSRVRLNLAKLKRLGVPAGKGGAPKKAHRVP